MKTSKKLRAYEQGNADVEGVGYTTDTEWSIVLAGERCPCQKSARVNKGRYIDGRTIMHIIHIAPFNCTGERRGLKVSHDHLLCEYIVACEVYLQGGSIYHHFHTPGKCPASVYKAKRGGQAYGNGCL